MGTTAFPQSGGLGRRVLVVPDEVTNSNEFTAKVEKGVATVTTCIDLTGLEELSTMVKDLILTFEGIGRSCNDCHRSSDEQ